MLLKWQSCIGRISQFWIQKYENKNCETLHYIFGQLLKLNIEVGEFLKKIIVFFSLYFCGNLGIGKPKTTIKGLL